ncbi:hypothetical protein [Pelagibacterium montanilacus]|uniref:hypothetical protein n=1 Tax=Pelagibacterium montanilacus TaxID=2185280 RepID=UPI000F8EBB97|nr:hypothetical protein [Pelagibacterium montanilacus]
MSAVIAMVRREYLEHRAAFVIAPAILLGLALLGALYGTISVSTSGRFAAELPSLLIFYETLFAAAAYGWSVYLLVMLAFYFANAFSADSRNNAMLFWKSVPQSDLTIMGAKVLTGLTVFPLAILLATGISGIIAYLPAFSVGSALSEFAPPDPGQAALAWVQIMVIACVYFAVGLLWYLPFLCWIGFLSTIFARWAMPLAVLIPMVGALIEFMATGGAGPRGGYLLAFLRDRLSLDIEGLDMEMRWLSGEAFQAGPMVTRILGGVDWLSLGVGLGVAAVLVFLASEYRRRYILS